MATAQVWTLTVEQRAAGPRQRCLRVANALGVLGASVAPKFSPSGQRAVQYRSAGDDVFIRGRSLLQHRAETRAPKKKREKNQLQCSRRPQVQLASINSFRIKQSSAYRDVFSLRSSLCSLLVSSSRVSFSFSEGKEKEERSLNEHQKQKLCVQKKMKINHFTDKNIWTEHWGEK